MLIKKSFRVWQKSWKGYIICCAVLCAFLFCLEFDAVGFEKRVPEADSVKSVSVYTYDGDSDSILKESENIEAVTSLHRSIVQNKHIHDTGASPAYCSDCPVRIVYVLKNGRTLAREYSLKFDLQDPSTYGDAQLLQNILNCKEAVIARKQTAFEYTEESILGGRINFSLPLSECARLSGCSDTEEYLLESCLGYEYDAKKLGEEEKRSLLLQAILTNCENAELLEELYYTGEAPQTDAYAYDKPTYEYAAAMPTDNNPYAESYWDPEFWKWPIDYDKVIFPYDLELSSADMFELYSSCILPDLEDATLGTLWPIAGEEYKNTVCAATIFIDARQITETDGKLQTLYDNFYTTLTINSTRTLNWFRSKGIEVLSIAEAYGN